MGHLAPAAPGTARRVRPRPDYDPRMGNGFRFALQSAPQDQQQWLATARRAEELGYATLLMPDGHRRRPRRRPAHAHSAARSCGGSWQSANSVSQIGRW